MAKKSVFRSYQVLVSCSSTGSFEALYARAQAVKMTNTLQKDQKIEIAVFLENQFLKKLQTSNNKPEYFTRKVRNGNLASP